MSDLGHIGDEILTKKHQFLDPMRDSVPYTERIDLGNDPKHNGTVTFVAMPDTWPLFQEGDPRHNRYCNFRGKIGGVAANMENHHWLKFHEFIQSRGIWTLAYGGYNVTEAVMFLDTRPGLYGGTVLSEISEELWPSRDNPFLARAHGRPGVYTAGCRGPLCRYANTAAQRARYLGNAAPGRGTEEMYIRWVIESYECYIEYLTWIRNFRRGIHHGGKSLTSWLKLSLKDTLLIDVTDESDAL